MKCSSINMLKEIQCGTNKREKKRREIKQHICSSVAHKPLSPLINGKRLQATVFLFIVLISGGKWTNGGSSRRSSVPHRKSPAEKKS